jgi:striatin 1/3/4
MNPLPNRPLVNNTSIPLSLPNVPSFDQMAYHRPRKVLPEAGKDFPPLNGHTLISGPSSAPIQSGHQGPLLERNNNMNPGQTQQQPTGISQSNPNHAQTSHMNSQGDKEKEAESEGRQTAIFRPDDAGEWREKLRLSHEASEQARLIRESQSGANSWERHRDDDEDVKEDEGDVEDDDTGVSGDGQGAKVWKAKRTLRKLVV